LRQEQLPVETTDQQPADHLTVQLRDPDAPLRDGLRGVLVADRASAHELQVTHGREQRIARRLDGREQREVGERCVPEVSAWVHVAHDPTGHAVRCETDPRS
jgi:hypothetical protein